jgi:hypothetical protein
MMLGGAEYVLRHWCAVNQVGRDSIGFIVIDGISPLTGFE